VNISFGATNARYLRLTITANTGWPAGQLSDFEVFTTGTGTGPATLSASPASLTFPSTSVVANSATQWVTVSNTGTGAATLSSVTATGDFTLDTTCGAALAPGGNCAVLVTFHPTASGSRTGALVVAGNAANGPTTVALSGTGAGTVSTNLAAGKPTSESSHTQGFGSANTTDADQNSYWESANNAFPQWVQVDLGSAQSASRIVLQLPAGWGARDQTLSVLAGTDGVTFTTVKASAPVTFNPSNSNTVTITFTATTQRYFRLNITANTGWPAGQISSFQIWNS
jgi:hypothetical protein